MYSTFFGLEIAYRALASQQGALDVAGHNIANSNTPGYTRQVANLTATIPLTISASGKPLTMGSGSDLNNISRARDYFIDRQYRWENSKYQYWSEKSDSLTTVESLLNEPSDDSLNNDMSQFWSAWSELAKNPENSGARSVVKERAITLVDTFHNISQQISDMQKDLDSSVSTTVQRINTIADQIKELNVQIKQSEVRMDNANDLKDQRDALIDELSQYVPVRVIETQDPAFTDRVVGNVKIVIGDDANPDENILVDDQAANHLKETTPTTGFGQVIWDDGDSDTTNDVALSWGSNLHMGKLQADLEARDTDLKNYSDKIDTLAQGIAAAVNALHQDGQGLTHSGTGIDFFVSSTSDPITAANIDVNSVIKNDVNQIATGKKTDDPVEVGDNSIALAIASLSQGWSSLQDKIDAGGTFGSAGTRPVDAASFEDFYGSFISQVGIDVQQSENMTQSQSVLVTQMSNQRESVSGVSLDEEMANLIKFQKSYSAAARVVTVLDSLFDKILDMGVTR